MKCFMTGRECDNLPEKAKGAFMVSPFGFPFDDLYEHALQPTLGRIGHELKRADKTLQLGYVICQRICREILAAEYVVVDVSLANANVFYELGLAYSLGKKLVIVKNEQSQHAFGRLFRDEPKRASAVLSYKMLTDLQQAAPLKAAFDNAIELDGAMRDHANSAVFTEASDAIILNVESSMTPLAGLQEESVRKAVEGEAGGHPWRVEPVTLKEDLTAQKMVNWISDAKICVIDITHYQRLTNVYVYFFLGLAHGFQKEVVPVTNAPLNADIPFDIRGLWQVYFTGSADLKKWLADVLARARRSVEARERGYFYRQLWSPFMETRRSGHVDEAKSLHVMTCARNMPDKYRGDRTHLDKNDFTTVADLSLFIGETFERAKVQIEPPTSKRTLVDLMTKQKGKREINEAAVKALIEDIFAQFEALRGDWLIVGAPETSDYCEVVLACAHGITAYRPEAFTKELPFVFVKARSDDNPLNVSSFYERPSNGGELIRWQRDQEFECKEWQVGEAREGITHGVITMLNRPVFGDKVDPSKKFVIFSGFTGIATYAMLKILTDVTYRTEYNKLVKGYNGLRGMEKNVNILVTAKYCYERAHVGEGNPGDTRKLTALEFADIQELVPRTGDGTAQGA